MNQQDILDSLWVEKWRPKSLKDVALEPAYREKFEYFIKTESIPHLLFEGSAGTGKTTTARILIDYLDCECLKLNASDDRGIDTIRGKIKNFAKTASYKKFKIVFLDEMDGLTIDAMQSLRNTMEQYAEICRFILSCNFLSKIIDPIISRCQVFHFTAMPKYEVVKVVENILTQEKIGYEKADVEKHIELHYPDMRKCINLAQQNVRSGKFVYADDKDLYKSLLELIMKKDVKGIRQTIAERKSIEYTDIYRYAYDNVEIFEKGIRLQVLLDAAEYMWRDSQVVDREINFVAFCIKVMRLLK